MERNLKTSLFFLTLFFISGFNYSNPKTPVKLDDNRIQVVFTRHLKFNDLVKIKLDMAEAGITLDYKKLEFDENGGLMAIAFVVDCNDGFSGGASNYQISNNSKFGFFRDYNEESKTPFGTGAVE